MRAALLTLALLLLTSGDATAHTRSTSYSSWQLGEVDARVVVRVSLYDLTRLPWRPALPRADATLLDPDLARYLTERVTLRRAERACTPAAPVVRSVIAGMATIEWALTCDESGPATLRSDLFHDVAPSHLHIARVERDGAVIERLLTDATPAWPLSSARPGSAFPAYVRLGIEHIWTGVDHLAFVLALLLLATGLREMATVVTGFTLAHSLTLVLAVLGVVTPHVAAVESLIGLSIALVAAENGWHESGRRRIVLLGIAGTLLAWTGAASLGFGVVPALSVFGVTVFTLCYLAALARSSRPLQLRVALSFAFGLVHGFGFAGVLTQAELPPDRLVSALFGFNLGVELGQLVVVAALWPLLLGLARVGEPLRRGVRQLGSAALCGLGVFWCVLRGFGG